VGSESSPSSLLSLVDLNVVEDEFFSVEALDMGIGFQVL
jgi:hypothetical protein